MRTDEDLLEGANHVSHEWVTSVQMAAQMSVVVGSQSVVERACLEAGLLHYRCVVNFCCGNYKGTWGPSDIRPEDFLGRPWWPRDEQWDRHLRGRLRDVNRRLQHLSWERLDGWVMWPYTLLGHEADYTMRLFLAEVPLSAPWRQPFDQAADEAAELLPPRPADPWDWVSSTVQLAPDRGSRA